MPKSNIHLGDTQRTCKLSEGSYLGNEKLGRKNMKNSTKGVFSSRAVIPTINILPPPSPNQQLPKGIFHSGNRKGSEHEAESE